MVPFMPVDHRWDAMQTARRWDLLAALVVITILWAGAIASLL